MNMYESIANFKKESSKDDFETKVYEDFQSFLDDNNITKPTEDDINNYFTGMFYDIETEEDLDDSNRAEELIRSKYLGESYKIKKESSNITEDDFYEYFDNELKVKCKEISDILSQYGGVKSIDYSVEDLKINFQSNDFNPDTLSKYSNSIEFGGYIYFDRDLKVIKTDVKTSSGPNLLNKEFIEALNALYDYTH